MDIIQNSQQIDYYVIINIIWLNICFIKYIFTDIIYRKNDIIEIKHIHVDKYGDCIPFNPNNLHLPNNHLFGIVLETIYEKNKFIGYNILRLNLKEQIVMFIPSWCGVFTKKIMEIN